MFASPAMSNASLVALVGPSGAGKTTLARALQAAGCGRIATTTTRPARADEILGRDLHSVPLQQFNQLRTSGRVTATCEYSSASYGVQIKHLQAAAATALPQIIIVEPSGVSALRKFAEEAGMRFASVFVTLSADVVRTRLEARYANEEDRDVERDDRLVRALAEVNQWRNAYPWDLVVESGDTKLDADAVFDLITRPIEPADSFAACA